MSNPDIYTIGWICAVGVEINAAKAFLDERHENLEHLSADDNGSYTLGRIGKHNVVIAPLPHWQYGPTSAATVARDLKRTFGNIRIGLMVGVAGGAPSHKHDIRLGDIIVSSPGYASGGILQPDYGKVMQGRKFEMTGFLNQPPQFLLTAISTLESQYTSEGHNIEEEINRALAKNWRLRDKHQRPDPSSDRLYISSFIHAGSDSEDCAVVCDDKFLKHRNERREEEDNPAIHFGLMASASSLMKDAIRRDELAEEKDVLCFEMEAAGLMNHFPCLVIRGVCDYSDTHKSVKWQGYAAMAAAACAKDLLRLIPPTKEEFERNSRSSGVKESLATYSARLRFDNMDERQLKLQHESVPGTSQWLFETKEYKTWETQDLAMSAARQPLLLEGTAGSGKSILVNAAFERSRNLDQSRKNIHIAFFFDGTSKSILDQSSQGFYRSFLSQLLGQMHEFPAISEMTKSWPKDDNQEWGVHILQDSISRSVRRIQERHIYIYVDALNECRDAGKTDSRSGSGVIDFLIELQKEHAQTWLCFSSPDRNQFGARLCTSNVIKVGRGNQNDIKLYIDARMPQTFPLKTRIRLANVIADRASNMFLWTKYVMDWLELDSSLGYSESEYEKRIKGLKTDLTEFYKHRFQTLDMREPCETRRLLELMHVAMRPLTLDEAISALDHAQESIRFNALSAHDAEKRVRALCWGLVEVRKRPKATSKHSRGTRRRYRGNSGVSSSTEANPPGALLLRLDQEAANSIAPPTEQQEPMPITSDSHQHIDTESVVQFVHHSVKEFLDNVAADSIGSSWLGSSIAQRHLEAARICMRAIAKTDSQAALVPYADQFWTTHARKGNSATGDDFEDAGFVFQCGTKTEKRIENFKSAVTRRCTWVNHLHVDDQPNTRFLGKERSLLTLLAFEGCTRLLVRHAHSCRCLKSKKNIEILETALFLAAWRGWSDTVRSILEIAQEKKLKIDVNKVHRSHMTPLYAACFRGNTEIVGLLIEKDADIFGEVEMPVNLPFHFAAAQGYKDIVALFLETADKADEDSEMLEKLLSSRDNQGRTVFHQTAERGSNTVLDTLHQYTIDFKHILHAKDTEGFTAQQVATNARERAIAAPDIGDWIEKLDEVIAGIKYIMLDSE